MRLGGRVLWVRARVVLMSPAMPEAASRCPVLPLMEPMRQLPWLLKAWVSA